MKRIFFISLIFLSFLSVAQAQGTFLFVNRGARTRIGSIDGPYAGPDILGQMLIGLTPDSLSPVGVAWPHRDDGGIFGGTVTVPGIPGNTYVFAQMVAWDQTLWGSSLSEVPLQVRGYTDVVPLYLNLVIDPPDSPQFNQPAIVPVPEPAAWALLALAGGVLWGARFTRHRCRPHPK